MFKKYFSILILVLFFVIPAISQNDGIPERPSPPRLVNNLSKEFPNFISSQEEAQLEKKLQDFANQTSNQIVIVIVDDLAGLEAFDFATRLGQKWGVGQAKADNGIVVLVKPTGGEGHHDLFIAPGYGLQGAIPDLTTKQIRENEMNPYLRKGENYTALDKGTDVLMALAKGEYDSDAYGKKKSKNKLPIQLIVIIIFFILYVIIRASKGGKGGGGGGLSMGTGFFLGSMFGSGGFGGGNDRGGSSGGFGGFGGGGFGGGGSGGSW